MTVRRRFVVLSVELAANLTHHAANAVAEVAIYLDNITALVTPPKPKRPPSPKPPPEDSPKWTGWIRKQASS